MNSLSCDECRSIYRELRDASDTARQMRQRRGTTRQQLAAYLEGLDDVQCARMRANSPLWRVWRRLMRHRALTGHSLSVLPVSPGSLSNPN